MKILFIFGTRPEAIKLAPLIKKFKDNKNIFQTKVCITAQHRSMLDQVLKFFNIKPDFDLNLMKPNQSLFDITINNLKGLENVFNAYHPYLLIVQGDTTTSFVGALAGYYNNIKLVHIEAGLRSGNKYAPFPEEINRILISHLADYHFAATKKAKENLLNEGIKENIWVVGNTVIDALFLTLVIIKQMDNDIFFKFFEFLDFSKKIILVTAHRRESFGRPFENICNALKNIADNNENLEIVYPVHLNPKVNELVNRILKNHKRVHLIKPLDYPYLLWLMSKSYLILTDSGGIQEEAPSLGKPVLVMREFTERVEGIKAGTAKLVGTDKNQIIKETTNLLINKNEYNKIAKAINPYGDGTASDQILKVISNLEE